VSAARLIAVDWGTTSLRCYLVGSDGTILARHEAPDGILAVAGGDFAGVLSRALSGLGDHREGLPIIMSGMIGSRQGWFEAPYVRCPASLADIAARLQVLETPFRNDVYLVPGLADPGRRRRTRHHVRPVRPAWHAFQMGSRY
jgi:2-dehydro-3-deoxygalactonokinase